VFDDKIQSVQLGTIAENKRLGVALALVKEQPTTCPPHQRRYPARQRPPNNLDAPGMPMKRRLSRCAAEVALARTARASQANRPVCSIVQRYVTQNDDAKIKRTVKLKRHACLAATDAAMGRTDPRLTHCAGLRARGLKGYATRTGKPAVALDPLALTPAFG
jgi:hypothetical protein